MTYDRKGRVIGCGYCKKERTCVIHDPRLNQAREGCTDYKHISDV